MEEQANKTPKPNSNNLIIAIVVIAIIGVIIYGVTQKPKSKSKGASATTQTETTVEATSETESETAETTTEPQVSEDEWKEAYREYINGYDFSEYSFELIFVDDDEIPELFISAPYEAAGEKICTYHDGKVKVLSLPRLYGTCYIPKSGLIMYSNGHMEYMNNDIIYKLEDGEFKVLHEGKTETVDYNTYVEYVYIMDGKEVSYNEYGAILFGDFDSNKSKDAIGTCNRYQMLDKLQ